MKLLRRSPSWLPSTRSHREPHRQWRILACDTGSTDRRLTVRLLRRRQARRVQRADGQPRSLPRCDLREEVGNAVWLHARKWRVGHADARRRHGVEVRDRRHGRHRRAQLGWRQERRRRTRRCRVAVCDWTAHRPSHRRPLRCWHPDCCDEGQARSRCHTRRVRQPDRRHRSRRVSRCIPRRCWLSDGDSHCEGKHGGEHHTVHRAVPSVIGCCRVERTRHRLPRRGHHGPPAWRRPLHGEGRTH